jgi:Protein of unknown function (DUF3175)
MRDKERGAAMGRTPSRKKTAKPQKTARRAKTSGRARATSSTTTASRTKAASRPKTGSRSKTAARRQPAAATGRETSRYWSQAVTTGSNALDLDPGVFSLRKPADIARSLKRSAEASKRRKSSPYQSAMSMLTFYLNRAGRKLPESRKRVLEKAKDALRKEFGRAER